MLELILWHMLGVGKMVELLICISRFIPSDFGLFMNFLVASLENMQPE